MNLIRVSPVCHFLIFFWLQIALPLVLQDKVNVLETFAAGNPRQQSMIVQMLDGLCDKATVIDDVIR